MPLASAGNLTVRGGNMAPTTALACVFHPPPPQHEGAASPQPQSASAAISVPARFVSVEEVLCNALVRVRGRANPNPNPNPNPSPNQACKDDEACATDAKEGKGKGVPWFAFGFIGVATVNSVRGPQ